jgi:hypothetical protein
MPRQRSKTTSASRETAQKSVSEIDRENGQYESGNESVDMQEIGSDEEELDRLVFGNEAEFKAHLGHGIDRDEAGGSDGSEAEAGEGDEEEGLQNVNDADVGSPLPLTKSPINFSQALFSGFRAFSGGPECFNTTAGCRGRRGRRCAGMGRQ